MRTANPRRLLPLLLALAFTLSTSACRPESMVRSTVPTKVPEVRCSQKTVNPTVARAPRSDEWVEWLPPAPGQSVGAARLSERASTWIVDLLATVEKLRGVRRAEHDCIERLDEKGLISQ